ncbi:MAG: 2-C-methyl-D-erythritol 4-phosphate cytidylyltransferase [Verrucomicrobiales bacterium]
MVTAILVAAGSSRRMGFDKLTAPLGGLPVAERSLRVLCECRGIHSVVVVTTAEKQDGFAALAERSRGKLAGVCEGGAERHLSVWAGLRLVPPGTRWVAVHDAARPLVSQRALAAVIAAAREAGAAALAHRVTDTLKRADASARVIGSVDREGLWAMETPQVFRLDWLQAAYAGVVAAGTVVTDEVSAIQAAGHGVCLVENSDPNPKITVAGDLVLAEALLRAGPPSADVD